MVNSTDQRFGEPKPTGKPTEPLGRAASVSLDTDGPVGAADLSRQGAETRSLRPPRRWPLLLLAAPAGVATWSGWVELGAMTGFGKVHPLPGIWDSATINTAITLPLGLEAYAAYALGAWISPRPLSRRTRAFARRSAVFSLILGMAGQAGYHLLSVNGFQKAPWPVTVFVSCLPVLVLFLAAALGHMIADDTDREAPARIGEYKAADAASADGPSRTAFGPDDDRGRSVSSEPSERGLGFRSDGSDWSASRTDGTDQGTSDLPVGPQTSPSVRRARPSSGGRTNTDRMHEARVAAGRLVSEGRQITRAGLREQGIAGSNESFGRLVGLLRDEFAQADGLTGPIAPAAMDCAATDAAFAGEPVLVGASSSSEG